VPNPNITIRNFFIAILQAVWFAVWGKIAEYLDQALQMLLRAQEQYNEGMDGIGLTVLVRNSVAAGEREGGGGGSGWLRADACPPPQRPSGWEREWGGVRRLLRDFRAMLRHTPVRTPAQYRLKRGSLGGFVVANAPCLRSCACDPQLGAVLRRKW
jgi:hypothetical protein